MGERRVLFLMHEGVGSTIFQSQVAVHALAMRQLGYAVDVWTFETTRRHLPTSRRNLARVAALGPLPVRLLRGVHVFLPGSDALNALLLAWYLWRSGRRYDVVHARTDYSASVYAFVRRLFGAPLVWDCRGDAYPETAQALDGRRRVPSAVRRVILGDVARHERRAGAACTVANFVSRRLRERKSRSLRGQPTFVIPCAVSSRFFRFDPGLRRARRAELGIGADDVVLVYSGALSTYQGFEAYAGLVSDMRRALGARLRFLVVTPDAEQARALLAERLPADAFMVHAAAYQETNGFLNAADLGALLREASPINDVASPTKFGEYCLAGLPVVIDGNVEQTVALSAAIGNGVSLADAKAGRVEVADDAARAAMATRAVSHFAREVLDMEYARLYETAVGSASPAGSAVPGVSAPRRGASAA